MLFHWILSIHALVRPLHTMMEHGTRHNVPLRVKVTNLQQNLHMNMHDEDVIPIILCTRKTDSQCYKHSTHKF